MENKFREFWAILPVYPFSGALFSSDLNETDLINIYKSRGEPLVKVVEKSALESANAEIERLKTALSVSNEALLWCEEMLKSRDEMNSKVHCAPVRLSPITERVMQAREFLAELEKKINKAAQ